MKIGKILVVLILIALVAWVGYRANQNIQAKKREAAKPAAVTIVSVETVAPAHQDIEDKIHSSGNLQADAEVSIFSKVPGKIANNLVKMGSVVSPGQVVSVVNRDEVGYDYKPYEVKSDAKGVVARILLNPGASVNPNSPILNLVDLDTVKVVAAVDEKKIRFIGLGKPATVTLEAFPGEIFSARVTNISPIADPVARTIDVELSISNASHRLKPGMYAEVEWVESRRTSLVVPLVSVVDRGGQKGVFTAGDGRARLVPITVGAVVGDVIEVLSGLKGDERVVTTGAGQLNDQDKITIVERPAAQK
ncbi:MAG: efflux RND transporter periplasmic adaptor subunit [Candidatus Aminicenantes bacterium]|nr:efflux RND transporter periplasmic adaptor subunit [Candidatus Aminicenantes bacterium]